MEPKYFFLNKSDAKIFRNENKNSYTIENKKSLFITNFKVIFLLKINSIVQLTKRKKINKIVSHWILFKK